MALSLLGEPPIASLESNGTIAGICKLWAEPTYESVLRAYRPVFSEKVLSINYNPHTELYILPNDYTAMRCIENIARYTVKAGGVKLHSSLPTTDEDGEQVVQDIVITYISNDINLLQSVDDLFSIALAYRIAANIAFPITKDANISAALKQEGNIKLNSWLYSNNQDRRPSRIAEGVLRTHWTKGVNRNGYSR